MKINHPTIYIFILVLLLVPSIFITEGVVQLVLNTVYPYKTDNTDIFNSIIYMISGIIGSFGIIAIYRKFIDKESFFEMGFSTKNRLFDLLLGIGTGIILISIGFVFLISIGNLEVIDIDFNTKWFFGSMILMILVSIHEEVIVRGYLLNSLMSVSNKYFAITLSSVLFGAMHLLNPNISALSFINIVLAGFLLGISYLHSKNLWFPMGLHFSWNFFQGPVLGFEVSGQEMKSLISQQISGNELITGGEFGFEGSLIATILMVVSIIILNWFFDKKEDFIQKVSIDFSSNELTIKEETK